MMMIIECYVCGTKKIVQAGIVEKHRDDDY